MKFIEFDDVLFEVEGMSITAIVEVSNRMQSQKLCTKSGGRVFESSVDQITSKISPVSTETSLN